MESVPDLCRFSKERQKAPTMGELSSLDDWAKNPTAASGRGRKDFLAQPSKVQGSVSAAEIWVTARGQD